MTPKKKSVKEATVILEDGNELVQLKVRDEDEKVFSEENTENEEGSQDSECESDEEEMEESENESEESDNECSSDDEQELNDRLPDQSEPQPGCSGYNRMERASSQGSANNNAKLREIDDDWDTEEERSMLKFARFLEKNGFLRQIRFT